MRHIATLPLLAGLSLACAHGHAATFTVTNTANSGSGSLRKAITDANAAAGADTIRFTIPGAGVQSIAPASPLPDVTDALTVDGYTQPGASANTLAKSDNAVLRIQLDGTNAGSGAAGLTLKAANCQVRGLVINRFSGAGILVFLAGSAIIEGNFLGTDAAGTAVLGNGEGVLVNSTANNLIGGTTPAARNVISGNTLYGVRLTGVGATGNKVQGNFIGLDRSGSTDLGNGQTGPHFLGFGGWGVFLNRASHTLIGGAAPGAGNVISGNDAFGVALYQLEATDNVVQGNLIGTDANGTTKVPNGNGVGVYYGASHNLIGGTTGAARNVISGNRLRGITVSAQQFNSSVHQTTTANVIQGNKIGVDVSGHQAMGNGAEGIFINGWINEASTALPAAPTLTIGGTTAGTGNVISSNLTSGIWIASNQPSDLIVIQGNKIGTDVSGTSALGNTDDGILTDDVNNCQIGGTAPGAGNILSGNGANGLHLLYSPDNVKVEGNYIGTNAAGLALGNGGRGVYFDVPPSGTASPPHGSVIGGTSPEARNVISGNGAAGVEIGGVGASKHNVQGNFIGLAPDGTSALPNGGGGVVLSRSASGNTIGGILSGRANRIAFNTGDGVLVTGDNTASNAIRANIIFRNTGLGINLQPAGEAPGTATPNDAGDGDAGPNHLQNFPVITQAIVVGGKTLIRGTLDSTPNTVFGLDFYSNTAPDPAGQRQGKFYLGNQHATTDVAGHALFFFQVDSSFAGQFSTALATNLGANETSEFSAPQKVAAAAPLSVNITMPANAATVSDLPVIRGDATDNSGGEGIDRVNIFLRRLRSADYEYWSKSPGSATFEWNATALSLTTLLSDPGAISTTWKRTANLPAGADLAPGKYEIIAEAYDEAGNLGTVLNTFTVATSDPADPPASE